MESKIKVPKGCPLCGTKLKKPAYICRNCNMYLSDKKVTKAKGKKARCPDCKMVVKKATDEVLRKEFKCRECGLSLVEMLNLTSDKPAYVESKAKEKLSALENKLETLSDEIDKILAEAKEEAKKRFACPKCKTEIDIETQVCPGCGIDIIELDELPEEISVDRDTDKMECGRCGSFIKMSDDNCPDCGIPLNEEEELVLCPNCDGFLTKDSSICPNCKTEFITEDDLSKTLDDLIEEATVQSFVLNLPLIDTDDKVHKTSKESEVQMDSTLQMEKQIEIPPVITPDLPKEEEKPVYEEPSSDEPEQEDHQYLEDHPGQYESLISPKKEEEDPLLKTSLGFLDEPLGVSNSDTMGFTNGMTNGLTNGLRAIRSGLTDGLTNGNGITNGLRTKNKVFQTRSNKMKLIVTPILVLLLVLSPYLITFLSGSPDAIQIDGRFGDWNGVITSSDENEAVPFNPNVDIIDYRIDSRQLELSFYLKVDGHMLQGEPHGGKHVDTAYIFIDRDRHEDTGYFINGIGADYLIKIYGWEGDIIKKSLLSYTVSQQDWNNWVGEGSVTAAVSGSELEAQIPYGTLNMKKHDSIDALFYMQSWDGFEDFSERVISNEKGVLVVTQQGMAEGIISGDGNRVLRLDFHAVNSDISFLDITVKRTGIGGDYDISSVRMEDENGNTVAIETINNGRVTFRQSITFTKDLSRTFYIYVDISYQAQPENSIGFTLESRHDVIISKGSVNMKEVKPEQPYYNTGYILSIPDNIKIDGAFADWNDKLVSNDTKDDTLRPEADIQKYGVASTDYGAAFFLEVDQEISAGISVPYWNRNTKPEPSIGGTTTGAAGEILPKTGEDIVYIFIDTIEGNGYQGNLPLTANYLIEITGRYNKVLSQYYYEWYDDGSSPGKWLQKGEVEVRLDQIRMEVAMDWINLGINPFLQYFDVFFLAADWERSASDFSDDTLFYSKDQDLLDNLLSGNRGTRGDYKSDHFHPTSGVDFEGNTLTVTDIDEDVQGDATYESWGGKGTNMWGECGYGGETIPGGAIITDMTVYMGYYHTSDWIKDSGHWGVVWSETSDGAENPIANYTSSTSDKDEVYTITTNLPTASQINSGIFIQVIGADTTGGPDYFYLDYLYFTLNYSIPDILINEVMSDPTGGPYDDDWSYRKSITIDEDKVLGDLEDFPVLISMTDSDLASDAQDDGDDILFTAIDGETKLDHEIEFFDGITGELVAWVKIPFISSQSDTIFYMYYGNSTAGSQESSSEVWEDNYTTVWHMNETMDGTANEFTDSTENNFHGQGGGGAIASIPMRVDAKLAGGQRFDGSNDYVDVSSVNPQDYDDFTISVWYKSSNTTVSDDEYIFGHLEVYGSGPGIVFGLTDNPTLASNEPQQRLYDNTNTLYDEEAGVNVTKDLNWHYITYTRNTTRLQYMIDGVVTLNENDDIAGQTINVNAPAGPYIGDWPGATEQVDGILDELRISNIARSVEWSATEYNNQFSPSTFYSVGGEESTSTIGSGHEWVELHNFGDSAIDLTGWYLSDNDGNKFSLTGAGSIPAGGYLVCHLNQLGTNTSTDVYGQVQGPMIQPDPADGLDNYLDDSTPTLNYGTITYTWAQSEGGTVKRPILQFDISSLEGEVIDARIWMYCNGGSIGSATIGVHRVTQAWTESGSNWNTYDGTNNWATAGGDYISTAEDTDSFVIPLGWRSWDITSMVTGWMAGDYENNGMIFVPQGTSYGKFFHSSDYVTNPALRPYIQVTYRSNTLGFADDLALMDDNDELMDYLAWGNDPQSDDDSAVSSGEWTDGEYIDISSLSENMSFGRDRDSTDGNEKTDWTGHQTQRADPFGIHSGSWTDGQRNHNQYIVINEILFDPIGNPYEISWGAKKTITINASSINSDLSDYPMYFKITDSDLASKAQSNGDDIIFIGPDGDTKLDHEIEYYNGATGELIAWIKIPHLSSISDTTIYMYYNNSNAANQENVNEVWSNGYVGVYHMSEDSGPVSNSVSSSNWGGRVNEPKRTSGFLGYGQEFAGSASEDMFNLGDLGIADGINENITFSVWAKIDLGSSDLWARFLRKEDEASSGYDIYDFALNDVQQMYGHINDNAWSYTSIADTTWHRFICTYDGSNKNFYINGSLSDNEAQTGPIQKSSAPVTIGAAEGPGVEIVGILDEVRISSITRTAEWVETEWNNQYDPTGFYFLDSELSTSGTVTYEWVELYNPSSSLTTLNDLYIYDNDGNWFELSGGETLAAGSYLMCYLGQSGTNSSSKVYGSIITDDTVTSSILGMYDDVAVVSSQGFVFDYVAWGADPKSDDDIVSGLGNWTDGNYVDSSLLLENQTLGRDMSSSDTDSVADWENATFYADPFGIHRSTVNGSSPGAQNVDIIFEFSDLTTPFVFTFIMFAVYRRRSVKRGKGKYEPDCQKETEIGPRI
jgi:hypothetical protein